MKAVMLSIRPEWCELITRGKKTIEVRKKRPKLETPFKCYIYCTGAKNKNLTYWMGPRYHYCDDHSHNAFDRVGNGAVIGEFVCDKIYELAPLNHAPDDVEEQSCLTREQIVDYLKGKGCGWHISNLKIYDKPKKLYDFYKPGAPAPDTLDEELCSYCEATDCGEHKCYGTPNGPVLCEGAWCDDAYEEYLDQNFALERPPQPWCYVEELEQ